MERENAAEEEEERKCRKKIHSEKFSSVRILYVSKSYFQNLFYLQVFRKTHSRRYFEYRSNKFIAEHFIRLGNSIIMF